MKHEVLERIIDGDGAEEARGELIGWKAPPPSRGPAGFNILTAGLSLVLSESSFVVAQI